MTVESIRNIQSVLKNFRGIFIGVIRSVTPKTNPMLATLDPITFPKEIPEEPTKAAFKLTISSGIEVANETTVSPIIIVDIPNLEANAIEDRSSQFPPKTNNPKPAINNKMSNSI